jgi:HPr kinase/phosphorylase
MSVSLAEPDPQARRSTPASPAGWIHGTALLIGETGILIRGASGSGKSSLALALLAQAQMAGAFASLVGDDRVRLEVRSGRLIARPHPALAGRAERRGQGIVTLPHEAATRINCVIDLVDGKAARDIPPRMPVDDDVRTDIEGVVIPRLSIAAGTSPEEGVRRVLAFLPYV